MKGICHTVHLHKNLPFNLAKGLAFSFKNKQANSKSIRYGPMNLSHSCPDFHQEITYPDQQFVTNSSSYWLQFIAQDVVLIWFSFWHLLLDWDHDFGCEYCLCHCLPFFLYWYSIMCQAWGNTISEWMQCTFLTFLILIIVMFFVLVSTNLQNSHRTVFYYIDFMPIVFIILNRLPDALLEGTIMFISIERSTNSSGTHFFIDKNKEINCDLILL